MALANDAPSMLRPLGIDIPVYPVKGYAVTLEVENADRALAEFDARFPLAPVGRLPAEWPPVADGEDE